MKKLLILFTLFSCLTSLRAEDPVLKTLMSEANRNLKVLEKQDVPAYFIAYRIIDINAINISANFGSLSGGEPYHSRILQVQTRVGDYTSDNS
ncbi:MAG TPA: hypothetical protein VIK20_01350, partial [Bacteroidales bacterium]